MARGNRQQPARNTDSPAPSVKARSFSEEEQGMIIRANHDAANRFFLVRRATAQDNRLSSRARGVLCFLLSKPDGWELNAKHLTNEFPDLGRDAAYAVIAELIKHGYAARRQERDAITGKVGRVVCDVYEMPLTDIQEAASPLPALPDTAQPDTAQPDTAKPEDIYKQSSRGKQKGKREQSCSGKQTTPPPPVSVHTIETLTEFVRQTKPHARNPRGLAQALWQSGEDDAEVNTWLNASQTYTNDSNDLTTLSPDEIKMLVAIAKEKQPEELTDWQQELLRRHAA